MNLETKDIIGLSLAVVGAWPVFKGWFINFWSWNRNRKLAKLRQELELMTSLNNSDRALLIFSMTIILTITAMFGASFLFHIVASDPNTKKYSLLIDWLIGLAIYMFSIYRLGQIYRLKNYEKTSKKLIKEIQKLSNNDENVPIDGGTF